MIVKFDIINDDAYIIASDDVLEQIRFKFSIENAAKNFVKGNKKKFIPSRLYAIAPTGKFEIGLAGEILRTIASKQLASKVEMTDAFKMLYKPTIDAQVYNSLAFELRDYQHQGIERALKQGRGICLLATGAGKTLLMASLAASIKSPFAPFKCLIVVPDPGLALQTYNDFQKYQVPFKVSLWTGENELDKTADVIIANQRILLNRADENKWIYKVTTLIVDEVHTIKKDNKINKIINKIETNNRFGMTGTLPTAPLDKWNVLGLFGEILIIKSSAELRAGGYLAAVEAKILNITYKNAPKPVTDADKKKLATAKYRAELDFLHHNEYRNSIIKQICCGFNNNVLIMVNNLVHGEVLKNKLSECSGKQVYFISGAMEMEDREFIKQLMEQNNDIIVIAMSKIFSTGISINNIHMIVFAAGGKSFVRVVQSIGRGLRLHESKNKLIIIDVQDNLEYGGSHAGARTQIYESEKINFSVNYFVEKR